MGFSMHDYRPHSPCDAPIDPERCRHAVSNGGRSVDFHQCTRKAVKDGYCRLHHPDAVTKRNREAERRRQEKIELSPRVQLGKVSDALLWALEKLYDNMIQIDGEWGDCRRDIGLMPQEWHEAAELVGLDVEKLEQEYA